MLCQFGLGNARQCGFAWKIVDYYRISVIFGDKGAK